MVVYILLSSTINFVGYKMHFACPSCQTVYEIDVNQLGETGQQYQCVNCNSLFFVEPPAQPQVPQPQQPPVVDVPQTGVADSNVNAETMPISDIPSDTGQQQQQFIPPENQYSNETELPDPISGFGAPPPNEPSLPPANDPQPPSLDFSPPTTEHAPTELPTGYVSDESQFAGQQGSDSSQFSPPTSHIEFPSGSVPPVPTNTPAEFNPYDSNQYGGPPQQKPGGVYSRDFTGIDDQSIHLADEEKDKEDINETDLWNVKIGNKVDRGLQLIQLKNWIRNGTLRGTDEVQEPGGPWVSAAESLELERFFRLKAKIEADKIAKESSGRKSKMDEIYCLNHKDDRAEWTCVGCDRTWCDDCVEKRVFGGAKVNMCPKCGDRCMQIERKEDVPAFWQQLPDIFQFPLRRHGPMMLGFEIVLWTLANLILIFTFGFGLFVSIALMGMVFSYNLQIIRNTARPNEKGIMPDFPDISDNFWGQMMLPFFQILIAMLLYFVVPIFLAVYFISKYQTFFVRIVDGKLEVASGPATLIFIVFTLLGYYFFPMVILVLARHHTVIPAFNPIIIFNLIKRVVGAYTLLVVFISVILIGSSIVINISGWLLVKLGFPFLLIITFRGMFIFYTYAIITRMMGLFLKREEEDLAWVSY